MALLGHIQNRLYEEFKTFKIVRPLFIDFELRAKETTIHFEAVFLFGTRNSKSISNLDVKYVLENSLNSRFYEAYGIQVYNLDIGKCLKCRSISSNSGRPLLVIAPLIEFASCLVGYQQFFRIFWESNT